MTGLYGVSKFSILILVCGLFLSCSKMTKTDRMELNVLANEINSLFVQAGKEIETLKAATQNLVENSKEYKGLFDGSRYRYTDEHVYYTPEDDGNCEVWASGYIPVGSLEKQKIMVYENLCPDLKKIYHRNEFIDTVYFTTRDSIVMGYPYADMHAYLKPGLDLTKVWVTYREAAQKANPGKKTLWVNPYIDAVGRGYMASVITPVYHDGFLEGTLGIDITVDFISSKFISLSRKNLMIVTHRTIPVAMNKNSYKILRIKGLEKYNYLRKEAENKSISSSLRMAKSESKDIRAIATWIMSPEKEINLSVYGRGYFFVKEEIPEIDWFLVEMKKSK